MPKRHTLTNFYFGHTLQSVGSFLTNNSVVFPGPMPDKLFVNWPVIYLIYSIHLYICFQEPFLLLIESDWLSWNGNGWVESTKKCCSIPFKSVDCSWIDFQWKPVHGFSKTKGWTKFSNNLKPMETGKYSPVFGSFLFLWQMNE